MHRGTAVLRLVYEVGREHGGRCVPNTECDIVIFFVTGPCHKEADMIRAYAASG